jgi:hypothetical protein
LAFSRDHVYCDCDKEEEEKGLSILRYSSAKLALVSSGEERQLAARLVLNDSIDTRVDRVVAPHTDVAAM